MTETIHLTCDRCGTEVVEAQNWAYVAISIERFHFCRDCWKAIFKMSGLDLEVEEYTIPERPKRPKRKTRWFATTQPKGADAVDVGELAHWVAAPMKDVGTSEQFHEVVDRAEQIIRKGRP